MKRKMKADKLAQARKERQDFLRRQHQALHRREEIGVQEWARNQHIRLAQEQAKLEFKEITEDAAHARKEAKRDAAIEEVEQGLAEFEQRAEQAGYFEGMESPAVPKGDSPPESREEFFNRLESSVASVNAQAREAQEQLKAMKARRAAAKTESDLRGRRRTAFLTSTTSSNDQSLSGQRDDLLANVLGLESKTERSLRRELEKIRIHELVFRENSEYRSQQVGTRALVWISGPWLIESPQHRFKPERCAISWRKEFASNSSMIAYSLALTKM